MLNNIRLLARTCYEAVKTVRCQKKILTKQALKSPSIGAGPTENGQDGPFQNGAAVKTGSY